MKAWKLQAMTVCIWADCMFDQSIIFYICKVESIIFFCETHS